MPRTKNITRQQWDAAASSAAPDPSIAATVRSIGLPSHQSHHSHSSSFRLYNAGSSSKENNENDENTVEVEGKIRDNRRRSKRISVGGGEKKMAKGKEKRDQRPLQDITELVVQDEKRSLLKGDDGGDYKGKKRAMTAMMMMKTTRYYRHEGVTRPSLSKRPGYNARFPSSLPPSSPPSYERRKDTKKRRRSEVWGEEEEEEEVPVASSDGSITGDIDDPFGFIVVERELKAQREAKCGRRQQQEEEEDETKGLVLVDDSSSPLISPYATPRRPRKKRRRNGLHDNRVLLLSASSSRMALPSSPSPMRFRTTTTGVTS